MAKLPRAIGAVASAPRRITVGFWSGLRYPFRGMRFVYVQHPELVRFWIFPICITAICLVLVLSAAWGYSGDLTSLVWEEPTGEGWGAAVGRFFHGFVEILVALLLSVLGLVVVAGTSSILAAPFNDALSEEVERIVTGRPGPPFSWQVVLRDGVRTVLLEILKIVLYLLVMGPLFVLSLLVPGLGQVLYSIFGFVFTASYFAIDYVDWPASRRNKGLRYRLSLIRQRFLPMFGFGAGVWLFLFIPIVNLFFMPAAVAGGTLLFLDMEGHAGGGDPGPAAGPPAEAVPEALPGESTGD